MTDAAAPAPAPSEPRAADKSLRDDFAGQVIGSIVVVHVHGDEAWAWSDWCKAAEAAYAAADAMLHVRSRRK